MASGTGLIQRALRWMRVSAAEVIGSDPETHGTVSVEGAGGEAEDPEDRETPQRVEQAALIGFGSVAEVDDLVAVKVDDVGGVAVAAKPNPPADSKGGDRYITHKGGGVARLTGTSDSTFEVKGTAALGGIKLDGNTPVARQGDSVGAGDSMALWISNVTGILVFLDPTLTPPADFGTITGGSAKVKAG